MLFDVTYIYIYIIFFSIYLVAKSGCFWLTDLGVMSRHWRQEGRQTKRGDHDTPFCDQHRRGGGLVFPENLRLSVIQFWSILYILILILDLFEYSEGLLRPWRLSDQLFPVGKVRHGEAFHCLECVLVSHVAWHFQACPSTTASSASYMSMIHTFWYCKGPSRPSRWS